MARIRPNRNLHPPDPNQPNAQLLQTMESLLLREQPIHEHKVKLGENVQLTLNSKNAENTADKDDDRIATSEYHEPNHKQ